MKDNVLFVCVHNSARSQMAEAFLRAAAGDLFDVFSAGIEAGAMNRLVVDVMAEIGFDLSRAYAKPLSAPEIAGRAYRYVITVCAESDGERCPVVPTQGRREHWSFPDPSALTGTIDERRAQTRRIRDAIRDTVEAWAAARRAERTRAAP